MDINVTNKTKKSCEVVHVMKKVWELLSTHRVSKIASSVGWWAGQTETM